MLLEVDDISYARGCHDDLVHSLLAVSKTIGLPTARSHMDAAPGQVLAEVDNLRYARDCHDDLTRSLRVVLK